jgi:hypothetical protein
MWTVVVPKVSELDEGIRLGLAEDNASDCGGTMPRPRDRSQVNLGST